MLILFGYEAKGDDQIRHYCYKLSFSSTHQPTGESCDVVVVSVAVLVPSTVQALRYDDDDKLDLDLQMIRRRSVGLSIKPLQQQKPEQVALGWHQLCCVSFFFNFSFSFAPFRPLASVNNGQLVLITRRGIGNGKGHLLSTNRYRDEGNFFILTLYTFFLFLFVSVCNFRPPSNSDQYCNQSKRRCVCVCLCVLTKPPQ